MTENKSARNSVRLNFSSAMNAAMRASGTMFRHSQGSVLLLIAITVAALMLRLCFLGTTSLWIDEIWSIRISHLPWNLYLWSIRHQDPNMILYYCMLHVWMKLGDSEAMVRGLSVLWGVATVPVLAMFGAQLFGRRAGLIAGLLLTINVFHIQYSQEARSYSLVILLVSLSSWCFVSCVESPRWYKWACYSFLSTLAIYSHLFAIFVIMSHVLSMLWAPGVRGLWKQVATALLVVGVCVLPLAVSWYTLVHTPFTAFDWGKSNAHEFINVLSSLAGKGEYPTSPGNKLMLAMYGALCCATCWSTYRLLRRSSDSREWWPRIVLAWWFVVPIALVLFISITVLPMLVNRYCLICMPPLILFAAKGIDLIELRIVRAAVLVGIMALSVMGMAPYYRHRAAWSEWKSVTDYIVENQRPGDAAIFSVAPSFMLFDYYRQRYHPAFQSILEIDYPNVARGYDNPESWEFKPALSSNALESIAYSHNRVWVIRYHDQWPSLKSVSDRVTGFLSKVYPLVEVRRIGYVTIMVYSRHENAPVKQSLKGNSVSPERAIVSR